MNKNRRFALVLVMLLVTLCFSTALAAKKGKCGKNLKYTLTDDGVLTISGKGAMRDFDYDTPWIDEKSQIQTVVIGDGVTYIGKNAFSFCENLISVTIPSSVTEIGDFAFDFCTALAGVVIPESVTQIGFGAFRDCNSLAEFNIPEGVVKIDNSFSSCAGLSKISIPASTVDLGFIHFEDCASLTEINVAEENPNFASVDGVLFSKDMKILYSCPPKKSGLYAVPDGVEIVYNAAFKNCTELKAVTFPDTISEIRPYAFAFSGLKSVIVPDSLTHLDGTTFKGCKNLENFSVEEGSSSLVAVDGVLFSKNMQTLLNYPAGRVGSYTVPEEVQEIYSNAFSYCSGLDRIFLPNVTLIRDHAFEMSGIKEVSLGAGLTLINESAFNDCSKLVKVEYDGTEELWREVKIESFNDSLSQVPIHCKGIAGIHWSLEDGVLTISGKGPMKHYYNGEEPYVGKWDEIRKVTIEEGVTNVGFGALGGLHMITELIIPAGVERICNYAITSCYGLQYVAIPVSVKRIDAGNFTQCYTLKEIRYSGTKEQWNDIMIEETTRQQLQGLKIVFQVE